MEQTKFKNNIIKIFIISFFNSMIFAYVVERVFALERGLSLLQIQYIIIIYALVSLILEVPCGVLADKWKKKYVLALGLFFRAFEFFICIFAYRFGTFALAFSLAAVGGSLKSGTIDSLIYESLDKTNKKDSFEKYMGMIKLLRYSVTGTASIAGGFLAHKYGLTINYWLSLIGTPISILLSLTIYEPAVQRASKMKFKMFEHVSKSVDIIKKHPGIGQVILYSGLTGAILYGQLHEMPSAAYPSLGIPVYMFGFITFTITLTGGLAGMLSGILTKKYSHRTIFNTILITSSIAIYLFSLSTNWLGIIYLIMAIFIMEIISPIAQGYIHKKIEDEYRATISSMQAFILQGLTIAVSLVFGFVANKLDIFGGFKAMTLIQGCYTIYFLKTWKEGKQLKTSKKVA